jgi:hypothetical protein
VRRDDARSLADVGCDRGIHVSNQINAPARAPDTALYDFPKLHTLLSPDISVCKRLG